MVEQAESIHEEDVLAKAIQNLTKKKHVVSEEAIKAKEAFDLRKQEVGEDPKKVSRQISIVEEFNHSVRLLTSIFQQSRFDELVFLVASPTRVLILNFCIGILRGLGFIVGVLLVLGLLAFLIQESIPNGIYTHLAKVILIIAKRFGL